MNIANLITASLLCFTINVACATSYEDVAQKAMQQKEKIIAAYQEDVKALQRNMAIRAQKGDITSYSNDLKTLIAPKNTVTQQEKRHSSILVFVSFSMPKESLEEWLLQAKKANANLVLRGLFHNSFKETASLLKPLVEKTKSGFLLDPTLFRRYGIKQVPAVIVEGQDGAAIVYGNAGLPYALSKISSETTEAGSFAKEALTHFYKNKKDV
ncbi:MAG: hypothetical protein LEGION0398_MBIBDBAK_00169 [Legionellaceae bacterium]